MPSKLRIQSSFRCTSALLLAAAVAALSCGPVSHPPTDPRAEPSTLDRVARQYVRLVLALGERDPDSLDFSTAPETIRKEVHASYPTIETIAVQTESLRAALARVPISPNDLEAHNRAFFLDLQLAALDARTSMLRGRILPFDQEASQLFATARLPDHSSLQRRDLRAQIAKRLPPSGLPATASPAQRYAAYDRRFLVPQDRLATVMQAALAACRRQTLTYLRLPPGESVELRFVRNQPWSAFSRYRGSGHSIILLNLDLPVTVDEVLELACHEGYPGHHVFNTLREAALVEGKGWPEAQVQPTFSPQSYVSEAAAAFAPRMAFTLPERIAVERTILFPLAGLPAYEAPRYVTVSDLVRELASAEPAIAREYLDGRLEFARAEETFEHEVLMAHAEATLLYLNEYRSYMLAYTDGPQRMDAMLAVALAQRRHQWEEYRGLMTRLIFKLPPGEL